MCKVLHKQESKEPNNKNLNKIQTKIHKYLTCKYVYIYFHKTN